eukprot:9500422-Pyramimonas_sp.AAC.1
MMTKQAQAPANCKAERANTNDNTKAARSSWLRGIGAPPLKNAAHHSTKATIGSRPSGTP